MLGWPRPPTEEPGQPALLSRMASLSGITVGLQQLGQPSAGAYHQLPSSLSVSPENSDFRGILSCPGSDWILIFPGLSEWRLGT